MAYEVSKQAESKTFQEFKGLVKGESITSHTHTPSGLSVKRKIYKKRISKNREAFIRAVDDPEIRIKTKGKVPKRGNNWKNWYEKLTWKELITKYGEAGARAGKQVKYRGRKYFLYIFDSDQGKASHNLSVELKNEISNQNKKLAEKWKTAYNKTKHGDHFYILSKEKLPTNLIIKYRGKTGIAELLGLGRQAQAEGPSKEYQPSRRPFRIVKNIWGLCQILNRKGQGWSIKESYREKTQQIIKEKQPTNIKVYQPLNISENTRQLLIRNIKLGKHQQLKRPGPPIYKKWYNGTKYFLIDTKYSGNFDETILDRMPEGAIKSVILARGTKHNFFKQLWQEP